MCGHYTTIVAIYCNFSPAEPIDRNKKTMIVSKTLSLSKTRASPERPYEIFGHPSRPKDAFRQDYANCLRPQAEFSRASGRGIRRVKNFIQDAKGMCKKNNGSGLAETLNIIHV